MKKDYICQYSCHYQGDEPVEKVKKIMEYIMTCALIPLNLYLKFNFIAFSDYAILLSLHVGFLHACVGVLYYDLKADPICVMVSCCECLK